ncbi:hypothetical protein [Gorillibacterium massiliense]|nr:hypothetical protein [Gorillibacterium massiliense]
MERRKFELEERQRSPLFSDFSIQHMALIKKSENNSDRKFKLSAVLTTQ